MGKSLTPKQLSRIKFYFSLDYRTSEIAELMSLPESTVSGNRPLNVKVRKVISTADNAAKCQVYPPTKGRHRDKTEQGLIESMERLGIRQTAAASMSNYLTRKKSKAGRIAHQERHSDDI